MSGPKPIKIACDGCAARLGVAVGGWPALQRLARNTGWVFRREGHGAITGTWKRYCPTCAGARGGRP